MRTRGRWSKNTKHFADIISESSLIERQQRFWCQLRNLSFFAKSISFVFNIFLITVQPVHELVMQNGSENGAVNAFCRCPDVHVVQVHGHKFENCPMPIENQWKVALIKKHCNKKFTENLGTDASYFEKPQCITDRYFNFASCSSSFLIAVQPLRELAVKNIRENVRENAFCQSHDRHVVQVHGHKSENCPWPIENQWKVALIKKQCSNRFTENSARGGRLGVCAAPRVVHQ